MLFCQSYWLVAYDDAAGLAITVGAAKLSRGIGLGGLRQRSRLFPRGGLGGGCRSGTIAAAAGGIAAFRLAAAAALLDLVDGYSQAAKIFKEVAHGRATTLLAAASATIGFAAFGLAGLGFAALRLAALRLAALGLGSTALGRFATAGFGLAA